MILNCFRRPRDLEWGESSLDGNHPSPATVCLRCPHRSLGPHDRSFHNRLVLGNCPRWWKEFRLGRDGSLARPQSPLKDHWPLRCALFQAAPDILRREKDERTSCILLEAVWAGKVTIRIICIK